MASLIFRIVLGAVARFFKRGGGVYTQKRGRQLCVQYIKHPTSWAKRGFRTPAPSHPHLSITGLIATKGRNSEVYGRPGMSIFTHTLSTMIIYKKRSTVFTKHRHRQFLLCISVFISDKRIRVACTLTLH